MAKILIADDDHALRDFAEHALTSEGHSVLSVADGGEALAILKSGDFPDLLVADVDMPVLDGIALARTALSIAPQLRILMISGMMERLDMANAIGAETLETLQKPFSLDALRSKVNAVLA